MYARLINGSRGLRRFAQRWGLLVLVVLLLGSGWAFILSTFAEQKRNLIAERQRELAQLNSAVAQQTDGLLKFAEMNLRAADSFLQANPKVDPHMDVHFAGLANALRRSSHGLVDLRMVSENGDLYFVPSLDRKPTANIRDRDYFREQMGPGMRSVTISDPIVSRMTGKWVLTMSWRLEKPVGGMVMTTAAIDLDRLVTLHEKMRLKPAGTITLLNTAGTVLSRTPHEHSLIGKSLASSPHFKNDYGVKSKGSFIADNAAIDGISRLISFERLEEFPVIVMVTEGLDVVLAPHIARRDFTYAVGAVLSLVILVFTFFLQRFVGKLHSAQENLQRLATIDSLTGTLSRRAFLEMAQREFSRAQRYERPTVVIVCDLDKFKLVNDTHGHAVGDTVLRECCAAWMTVLRQQDYIGRIGGEEFCAILPETDVAAAKQVAERLRQITARLRFAGADGEFFVTVSVGLSEMTSSDEQLAAVMERADKALYTAKRSGRNRVEVLDAPKLEVVLEGVISV